MWMILAISLNLAMAFLLAGCQSTPEGNSSREAVPDPIEFTTRHLPFEKLKRTPQCCTAEGSAFAVAAAGTHAAKAAKLVHDQGCNVVDAAVAATFVLAVERAQSTGLTGGGFAVFHLKQKAETVDEFVDFRETAPHSARQDMFFKAGKKVENSSRDGVHAAGTPGFVAGLFDIHEKYGSHRPACAWSNLLKPAIEIADEGFLVYPTLVDRILVRQDYLAQDPEAAKLFLPKGKPLNVGDRLIQKDLAKTLKTIAKTGKRDFYLGSIAKKITSYIRANAQPGIPFVDEKDLRAYRTRFRKPLEGSFGDYRILTAGPPSAGGVTLLESLHVLSGVGLGADQSQARHIHLLSETLLRAFADRTIIGDNQETKYLTLISQDYADIVRKHLNLEHATPAKDIKPEQFVAQENPHTARLSIMDAEGNAIAITTTVNYYFGAGRMVTGTGMFLNDIMDDFATDLCGVNISGLPGSPANAIAPFKRPVSSMVPSIFLKNDKPVLAIGAAGSSTIPTGVLQVVLNDLVIWPQDLRKAMFAGRMHKQYEPSHDVLSLEPDAFSLKTEKILKSMGHTILPAKFTAAIEAVGYNSETSVFTAVHEPRDEGGVAAE